jgi:hypothetical protein
MCVGGVPSTQRHRAFERRLWWQHPNVLQNKATGVREGMVRANAAGEVLSVEQLSIMADPMNPAGHGCAERARRSR